MQVQVVLWGNSGSDVTREEGLQARLWDGWDGVTVLKADCRRSLPCGLGKLSMQTERMPESSSEGRAALVEMGKQCAV